MSDSNEKFPVGVYTKGEKTRRVETRADAVAAKFEGFVFLESFEDSELEPVDEPSEVEDGVNGVGTLGTGDAPESATPAAPAPTASVSYPSF